MNFTDVKSSNIKSIAYEDGSLFVKYTSNVIYKYKNVPESIFTEMINSDSKGKFMNLKIKGSYLYEKFEV